MAIAHTPLWELDREWSLPCRRVGEGRIVNAGESWAAREFVVAIRYEVVWEEG
jgi:hypothetical protein